MVLWCCELCLAENCDVNIKFLHSNGSAAQFFWLSHEDTCRVTIRDKMCIKLNVNLTFISY